MAQGIYSCSCCEFLSFEEVKKYRNQIFKVGDKVKNRCINQRKETGTVVSLYEEKGYYSVSFGPLESDKELKHSEELKKY